MSWYDRQYDANANLKRAMDLLKMQPGIADTGAYGTQSAADANAAVPAAPYTAPAATAPVVNPWSGATGTSGNTGIGDQFTIQNPEASVRPLFEKLGLASRQGNDWVKYFSDRIAGGLPMLYEMQNPGAPAAGFTDWMQNTMQAMSAPGGNWNSFQQFGPLIAQLLGQGPGSGNAMSGYFGADVGAQEQAKYLSNLLQTYGSAQMTPGTQRAMLADLADKYGQYAGQKNMGQSLPDSMMEWLRNTNFFDTWKRALGA